MEVAQGVTLVHELEKVDSANQLKFTVKSTRVRSEFKAIPEGRSASLAFLRQGHDFLVESGFGAAGSASGHAGTGWSNGAVFGAIGGGGFRHKTGSHVDVNGVSFALGLSWRNDGPCGSLLMGAFFDAGYADYDTYNVFDSGVVRGDGDSRYFGGGILARYEWKNGFYAEASARVGGVHNKLHSDLTDVLGNRAGFDINAPYFGVHTGAGYARRMNEKAVLDISAKYLWSRQNGDTAVIAGDSVHFDEDSSHRVRTGARFAYSLNACVAPFVGAAFEYEFGGKARSGMGGHEFGVPSLKGGTGVGELGVRCGSLGLSRFSAEFGVRGYVGKRQGVSGNLALNWAF